MTDAEKQRWLEAWYAKAQNYDKSWFAPHFSTWRKGTPRSRDAGGKQETIFDELVRLGVLEKVKGPICKRREWEEEA